MKKILSVFLSVIMIIGFTSCGDKTQKAVVTVGEEKVLYEDFLKEFALFKYNLEMFYGDPMWDMTLPDNNMTMLDSLKKTMLEKTVEDLVVMQEAEKEGITLNEEQYNSDLKAALDELNADQTRKEFYELNGIDETFFEKTIKRDQIVNSYHMKKLGEITVTDEEVMTFIGEHKEEYRPETIRASHILIKTTDENGNKLPDNEITVAKEQIDSIHERLKNGESFEDLAKEFSQDGTAQNGGDLGQFGIGMMVKEFEDAAFALKVGEISDVVETQFGYHIIKLTDRVEDTEPSAEVKEMAKQNLVGEKYKTQIQDLVKSKNPKTNESLLKGMEDEIKYPEKPDTQGTENADPTENKDEVTGTENTENEGN